MPCAQVRLPRSMKFEQPVLLRRGGGGTLWGMWYALCAGTAAPVSEEQTERLGRGGGETAYGGGSSFCLFASFGVPG
jgi:hypothetical protein